MLGFLFSTSTWETPYAPIADRLFRRCSPDRRYHPDLQGQPRAIELSAAAMPSLVELHAMAGVHQLPDQDIDDQSLVFPTSVKQ
ncbi:hypothetical protein ACQ5SK_19615 [Bradyrhizobium japonicum]